MANFRVALNPTTKVATVLASTDAIPNGFTVKGSFDHGSPDSIGYVANHVLYHHIRDVLVANQITTMADKKLFDGAQTGAISPFITDGSITIGQGTKTKRYWAVPAKIDPLLGFFVGTRWLLDGKPIGYNRPFIVPENDGELVLETMARALNGALFSNFSPSVTVSKLPLDTTPDDYQFINLENQSTNILVYSNEITITGINTPTNVTIIGGDYRINDGAFKNTQDTVVNGSKITLRAQTGAVTNTITEVTLNVGGVIRTWQVHTLIDVVIPKPKLYLSDAVIKAEGNTGTTAFTWTVTLDRDLATGPIPIDYVVEPYGVNSADINDFGGVWPSGSLTFGADESVKTITVLVTGDTAYEPDETFAFTVRGQLGYNVQSASSIGTIVNDDFVPVTNQTALFGSLTASGAVGFRPAGTDNVEQKIVGDPTVVSGTLAPYSMANVNGRLTFTGAAGAPDGLIVRCGVPSGATVDITVSVMTDAITLGNSAEYNAWANATGSPNYKAGKTAIVRVPDDRTAFKYGVNGAWNAKFMNMSSKGVLRGEKPLTPPLVWNIAVISGSAIQGIQGNMDFMYLNFHQEVGMGNRLTTPFNDTTIADDLLLIGKGTQNIRIANCLFDSDVQPSRTTGMVPRARFQCITTQGSNVIIEDNVMTNFIVGITVTGLETKVRRNHLKMMWDDPFRIVNRWTETPVQTNIEFSDNHVHDIIGDNGYHPDFCHMFMNGGGNHPEAIIRGVTFRRNSYYPGYEGIRTPGKLNRRDGGAYSNEEYLTVGTRTIGMPEHQKVIYLDATTAEGKIYLQKLDPAVMTADWKPDIMIIPWFAPTAGATIYPQPGDSFYDINKGTYIDSFSFTDPWSTVQVGVQLSGPNGIRWTIGRSPASYQGIFCNGGFGEISNVVVEFNMLRLNSNVFLDNNIGDPWSYTNNTVLPVWPGQASGSTFDPTTNDRYSKSELKDNSRAVGNIAGAWNGVYSGGKDNCTNTDADFNKNWNLVDAVFNVNDSANRVWNPENLDQLFAMSRPKAYGLIPTGMGAGLSVDPANDYCNFVYGDWSLHPGEPAGPRTNKPWEVKRLAFVVTPGTINISWNEPAFLNDGAITGYTCQVKIDSGAWTNVPVTGTTAFLENIPKDSVIQVRVAASNANGQGCWAYTGTKVMTEGMPGAAPTLNVTHSDFVLQTSNQIQSKSFNVTAGKPLLVLLQCRISGPSSTSPMLVKATIGDKDRAFGTGTPLTLLASRSLPNFTLGDYILTVNGLTTATNQTIHITSTTSDNITAYNMLGVAVTVAEVTGANDNLTLGAVYGFQFQSGGTTASFPMKTQYDRSLIIALAAIGVTNQTFTPTNFDSVVNTMYPHPAASTVVAIRAVAKAGDTTQSLTWASATQCVGLAVELRAKTATA